MPYAVEKAAPRKVDYFSYASDFQCVLLASIGLTNQTISEITGLTVGQVMYRLQKADRDRRKGEPTSRWKYRNGDSEIAQAMIRMAGSSKSEVKRHIVEQLDKRGLYTPIKKSY